MLIPNSVFLIFMVMVAGTSAVRQPTVTNEDIRDAILQVVNVVRSIEDKLERHEYRERILGEHLKKGMISIDKRIKLLEPFKGTINRLDHRLAAVETILMQKDERERIQLQKTFETVEDVQKNLPLIVDKLKNDVIKQVSEIKSAPTGQKPDPNGIVKKDLDNFQTNLTDKIDKVSKSIQTMENDLAKVKEENKNIGDIHNKSSENLDKVKRQLDTSEQLLEKYENKLAEYNNKVPELPQNFKDQQKDWHTSFLQALDVQKSNVEQILSDVKGITSKLNKLPDKNDFENFQNSTIGNFEQMKENSSPSSNGNNINQNDMEAKQKEILKSVENVAENLGNLGEKMSNNFKTIEREIDSLSKVEQVMVQTADSVLDTKRRVEYGVHQIIAEIQQAIKASSKDVDSAISERFDLFEMAILDDDTGALTNLTQKIGQEIDQVWRQIGIMYQQMSANADTLNKLQNQTDVYVTGSLNVMDNMKGKVGTITNRISEVDDNLNYLMGKLSLVTQEFNQIKTGLGKALDEMRGTYKTVKDKISKGPHQIESEELETTN